MSARPSDREPGQRLVLGALLGLAFLLGCFPMGDFDVWWHLRAGQLILEQGAVPRTDLFTYTNADRPWIDLYWLFQIGLALAYRAGGASLLVLLKAACGVAIVGLSLLGRRRDARAWPAVLAWLPAVVLLSGRLCERPELVSLLLLSGFLAVLGGAAERPRLLWLLPVMQLVWVNCHGFFVLGPLLLAAYAAEAIYRRLRPLPADRPRPGLGLLALVCAATLLACAASPYGLGAARLPLEQWGKLGAGVYRTSIGELKTIGDFIAQAGINNPYLLGNAVVLGLGLASFGLLARRRQVVPFRALVFVAAAYLGWQATRNSSLFAVVAAFVTMGNLDDLARAAPAPAADASRKRSRSRSVTPRRRRNPNVVLLAAIAALAVAVLSGALYAWAGEGRRVGLGERRDWYAHEACAFLARPGLPELIVAYNLGQAAVCIAHTAPLRKQFMDPRLEVNRQETFERYLAGMHKLWLGEPGWEVPLGIDYSRPAELPALLIERGPLHRAADNLARDARWRRVFADRVATVFVPTEIALAQGLPEVAR